MRERGVGRQGRVETRRERAGREGGADRGVGGEYVGGGRDRRRDGGRETGGGGERGREGRGQEREEVGERGRGWRQVTWCFMPSQPLQVYEGEGWRQGETE